MSLATRCTSCGTVFRVVQDQLKVSEGWVRCGRCSQVFNALEALFDLERETAAEPAQATQSAPLDARPASVAAPAQMLAQPAASDFGEIDLDVGTPGASDPLYEPFDEHAGAAHASPDHAAFFAARPDDPHEEADYPAVREPVSRRSTPAGRVDERDRLEFPDARFDSEMLAGVDSASAVANEPHATEAAIEPAFPTLEASEPHFVLHAQRRAHWQTPKMVALQGLVLALLLVVLGLQYAHHFRDLVAARWPATAPALAALCAAASCQLEAPRRIDDLVVESTALTRAPLPDAFKVSVVLRNRGNLAVMPPSIDLSLTDASGQPVARRMLSPRDFEVGNAPLKPGLAAPWQLILTTAAAGNITGYTVEVFYP